MMQAKGEGKAFMIHRIFGWFFGYVYVAARGENMERFVNLCHNHEIILWDVSYSKRTGKLHFKIGLRDFYRLRPISRKSKVFLVVKYRYGFPFFIQEMKKQKNFFGGIVVFLCILLFLSTRIWGITVEGE